MGGILGATLDVSCTYALGGVTKCLRVVSLLWRIQRLLCAALASHYACTMIPSILHNANRNSTIFDI